MSSCRRSLPIPSISTRNWIQFYWQTECGKAQNTTTMQAWIGSILTTLASFTVKGLCSFTHIRLFRIDCVNIYFTRYIMRKLFISHLLPHCFSHQPPSSSVYINHTHKNMAIHSRQTSSGMSPAIVYGVVGVVAAILVMVTAACLINRQRKIRKRARQRLNNARQWELTNLTPLRRNTPDNSSTRGRYPLPQLPAPRSNPSLYRDRPLPPVPIRTRSRPPNRPSTSTPPVHPRSTRIPPAAEAILLDQGTTSDSSAPDIEPNSPVVNEVYARLRMEHDARFAQLGYTESEAMLASDTGIPSDDGVAVERGRQREAEIMRERVVQQAAQKVGPNRRAKSVAPTPARWIGVGVDDIKEENEGTSTPRRARSRGEPSQAAGARNAHLSPPRRGFMKGAEPQAERTARSKSRARLDEPFQDTNPYVPPDRHHLLGRNIEPPTPTHASASNAPLKPLTYDDVPIEESVDSSRFSQLDLGTSTEDGTYVSTDISDDPWREEVRANQKRWG